MGAHSGSNDPEDYKGFGPEFLASCVLNDEDLVGCVAVGLHGSPVGVCVEATQHLASGGLSGAQILLSPSDARRFAAALLNAADRVDGTVPLAFYERPAGDEE